MITSTPLREPRAPHSEPKKRVYASASGEQTMLLHVNLPASLVLAVRSLASEERRTITSQVALLLEESPELIEYQRETANGTHSRLA